MTEVSVSRPEGPKTLLDLFDGREQLVVYQFMDNGPDAFCPGNTHFTHNVADLRIADRAQASFDDTSRTRSLVAFIVRATSRAEGRLLVEVTTSVDSSNRTGSI